MMDSGTEIDHVTPEPAPPPTDLDDQPVRTYHGTLSDETQALLTIWADDGEVVLTTRRSPQDPWATPTILTAADQ